MQRFKLNQSDKQKCKTLKYLIQLLCVAKGAIGPRRYHRSDKVNAFDTERTIELIIRQNIQSKAMRMAEVFRLVLAI
jgi:hypothetical protein